MIDAPTAEAVDETPDFAGETRRTFVRVRGGRLLVNAGRGRPPLALDKLHGRLLGVTATADPGRPEHGIAPHWRCTAKLRTPALGEVLLETDTNSTTPFVGMVGGLREARLWSFVAFTAALAPRRSEDEDETPPTFLNVWVYDGDAYRLQMRDGFPEALRTGHHTEKAEAARRLVPSLPAYVDAAELGALPSLSPAPVAEEGVSTAPDPLPSAFGVPAARWPRSLVRPAAPNLLDAAVRRLEAKGFAGMAAWLAANAILRELGVATLESRDAALSGGQALLVRDFLGNADARALARLRDAALAPRARPEDDPFADE